MRVPIPTFVLIEDCKALPQARSANDYKALLPWKLIKLETRATT
jgi:hypothetical protein